jgi:serine/threonine protein kinase
MQTAKEFLENYNIDYTQALDQKGLGSVYIAKEATTEEVFAVKVVEMHPIFDKGDLIARYEKAMSLSHPNLLPYKAAYRFPTKSSHQHFILMPYINGGDLSKHQAALNLTQKREILDNVLEVLGYLHENACYLQNLRADHLLIKQVGDIYIPLLINYGATAVWPSAFFVNYEYLAPEQLQEEPMTAVDARTDIWAFGVLTYYVFTGQLPFGQKSPQSPNAKIKARILEAEIPGLLEQIPEPYRNIIRKSLQVEPAERWQSVAEIQAYIAEHPTLESKSQQKEASILDTLAYMGDQEEEKTESKGKKVPLLQRNFKRKPQRPVQWWEPVLWLGLAALVGYLLNSFL